MHLALRLTTIQKLTVVIPYKFDVCILFNGLRKYSDGWKSKSVSVKIEWRNDGSTWNDAGNIVTGDINSRKQVRFSKTVTLTAAQCVGKDIQIRLTRTTQLEESNSQETCYLWLTTIQKLTVVIPVIFSHYNANSFFYNIIKSFIPTISS